MRNFYFTIRDLALIVSGFLLSSWKLSFSGGKFYAEILEMKKAIDKAGKRQSDLADDIQREFGKMRNEFVRKDTFDYLTREIEELRRMMSIR